MRYVPAAISFIVLSLTALLAAQPPGGQKTDETPFLGAAVTRTLLVRVPGERLPLDFNQLNQLLISPQVAGLAVKDVSGKPAKPDEASQPNAGVTAWTDGESVYTVQCQAMNARGGQLELSVRFGVAAVRTDTQVAQFAEAIARRLGTALTEIASKSQRDSTERKRRAVEMEHRMAQESEDRVKSLRNQLREIAPIDATQALLTENIGQLQRQQQSFEIDLAGMKGRAVAIQDHVQQLSQRLQQEPENDEVVKNLQRVVKLRATQLERVTNLRIHRVVDETAKAQAEEQLVLAQVELDRARRESRKSSSDQLEKLNVDLTQIAISTAEIDAKLKFVAQKLAETRKKLDFDVHQAQPLRDRLAIESDAYQAALAEAQKREAEYRRSDASAQPVTVELGPIGPTRKKDARN